MNTGKLLKKKKGDFKMVQGINFSDGVYARQDYYAEKEKELEARRKRSNASSAQANETSQKGLTGSKHINVNDDGMFEVKLKNEPTRLFYSENEAMRFEVAKTTEKYQSLEAKVKRLEKYLKENRSHFSQQEIKRFEARIKEGREALSIYKERINSLTPKITQITSNADQVREIPANRSNDMPKIKMNGKVIYNNIEYPDLAAFRRFNPDVSLPKRTPMPQGKETPQVKKSDLPNSKIFPTADGKSYGDMLKENPLLSEITENTTQTTTPPKPAPVNQSVPKGDIPKGTDAIDPKSLPVKVDAPVKTKTGLWARIRNAAKGKGRTALVASTIVLTAAAVTMFVSKKSKPKEQIVENTNPGEINKDEQPVTSEQNETPEAKTLVQPSAPSPQVEVKPENDEYIVKKGDNIWNIAKRNLIEKNKDDKNYIPSDKEILAETKRIVDKNNLKFEDDNYHLVIKPGDRLQLAA